MKYFITLFLFLVFSTASVANDHVPVGKLSTATTPVTPRVLAEPEAEPEAVEVEPQFVDVAFTSSNNIVAVYWDNGNTMYFKAAVVTKGDLKSIKRIAKHAGYLVQTAIYDPLEGIELISIIDHEDTERFYVRYFPMYVPSVKKGGK